MIINIQVKTCMNGPQLNQKPLKAGRKRNLIMAAISSRRKMKVRQRKKIFERRRLSDRTFN